MSLFLIRIVLFGLVFFSIEQKKTYARPPVNPAFLRPLPPLIIPPSPPPPPEITAPEEPQGPLQTQFTQAPQRAAVEFKTVEGSNDGGTTTAPDKNLAAWYSEQLYDVPTDVSWADDDRYNQDNVSDNQEQTDVEKNKKTTPTSLSPQKGAASGTAGIGAMGGSSGGGKKDQNTANEERSLHQSLVQAGKAKIKTAERGALRNRAQTINQRREFRSALMRRTSTPSRSRSTQNKSTQTEETQTESPRNQGSEE